MAKIRNSVVPNTFGEGNEKIITLDNGEEYVVRNTVVPNTFGGGYEQEIVKRGSSSSEWPFSFLSTIGMALAAFGGVLLFGRILLWVCEVVALIEHI